MPPRKSVTVIRKPWFFILEIAGLGLSLYLFLVASGTLPSPPCTRNSIFACTSIIRGDFSHFGPFGVAAMGVIYYLCHLMLTVGLREKSAQVLKAVLVAGGLTFVAWLRVVELIYEHKICPWCWGVMLVSLIHAGFTYGLVVPPLPKLRPLGVGALVAGGFLVLVGLVSLVELTARIGQKFQGQKPAVVHTDDDSSVPVASPEAKATPRPTPKPTPKAVAKPTATPMPTPRNASGATATDAPPVPAVPTASPTPLISVQPTPVATATPVSETLDPEPEIGDSEEVRVLRSRGWRHAGSGKSVVRAVKAKPPVLLLAYDPHCSDCHRLITTVLNKDSMNGLRVTRICIQESMLSDQLNEMVKALPTMILFGEDGTVLWELVGSKITDAELVSQVNAALAKGTP